MSFQLKRNLAWLLLALIVVAAALIVWLAPAEQTIGQAIKYVYVHVALTRAGMYGFYLAGLLGLAIALTANASWQRWTQIVAWVAFILFLAGGIVSLLAEQFTWGGIPWSEPRNVTTLNVIAFALVVLIANAWLPWLRIRGLLYTVLAGYVAWVIPRTPLVLHPEDPVSTSSSAAIQWTFMGLTLLALLLGIWLVWYWIGSSREQSRQGI